MSKVQQVLVENIEYLKSPLIIVGFGRSGTSIVADAIMQHRELAFISNYNARFKNSDAINLLRYAFDNRFWRLMGQKKQLNHVPVLGRYYFRSSESYSYLEALTGRSLGREFLLDVRESEFERARIRERLSKLVRLQGKYRLAFKITGPSRLGYFHSILPTAKFIRVVRDPLPNIRSLMAVDFYRGRQHSLWWKGNGVYTSEEKEFVRRHRNEPELIAALQYFKINRVHDMEVQCYGLQNRVSDLRYEDFVKNPVKSIQQVLKFANLPMDPSVEGFLQATTIVDRNLSSRNISTEGDAKIEHVARFGLL